MAFKSFFCNVFWRNIVHHFYFFVYISQAQNVLNLFLFFDEFQSRCSYEVCSYKKSVLSLLIDVEQVFAHRDKRKVYLAFLNNSSKCTYKSSLILLNKNEFKWFVICQITCGEIRIYLSGNSLATPRRETKFSAMLVRLFGPFLSHKVRLSVLTLFRYNFPFHFRWYTGELLSIFSIFYTVHTCFKRSALGSAAICNNWKPSKNDEKCFLFYIKSCFNSWDIYIYVLTFWLWRKTSW